ncbi:hypothetical protein WK11_11395 [Burkholderia ubonensis]|nr:hypothetical protein WJ76_15045 [Burkholderia ubonensis]KVO90428.1 hypothetical protein WJ80_33325 [Burkholderia ubonensis]KVP24649.1 hypothetical protein WJ85_00330 [Burkholderia ubonensis]KVR06216.1 hypothetical protein WK11_11395 [Burkholderia ubonensis]KVR20313.1 hypothetical protein WK14_23505 [Burkholderia ubonensis]
MNGDWAPFAVAGRVRARRARGDSGWPVRLRSHGGGGWADATSSDEAALIVMVVAMPLHFVLRRFYERR